MHTEFNKIVLLFFKNNCAIVIFRPGVALEPWSISGVKPGREGLENNLGRWQGGATCWRQGEEIPARPVGIDPAF